MLLDPENGTEPEIDFPDHDQDAGYHEACVAANTDHRADEEILNEKFEDDATQAICYLGIEQFQLEIYFQNNIYGPHKPSRRQAKDKLK